MIFKKLLLTEKYMLFSILTSSIFTTGCGSFPILSQFEMGSRPAPNALNDDWEKSRKAMSAKMKAIEKEFPSWKRAMDNDAILVDFYDENGKYRGTAVGH